MIKKKYKFIAILFSVILGLLLSFYVMPNRITNNIYKKVYLDMEEKKRNEMYDVNFILDNKESFNINTYFINRNETTESELEYYSEMFGVTDNLVTEKDKYVFSSETATLEIMKNVNMVRYTNKVLKGKNENKISRMDSVDIVNEFLNINNIQFNYEEIVVNYKDNKYEVNFLKELGNIKNFSFVNSAIVDQQGNILNIEYYFVKYKKLRNLKIKSMREAFFEMPLDFDDQFLVELEECELVYFYKDSIVQPAYLFTGATSDGKAFECFIKAININ